MLVENSLLSLDLFWQAIRAVIVVAAALYFIFSLIILRQVNLMTEVLITEVAPLLRGAAILHTGLALGTIILLIGFLLR
ncbi:MAG: hypothetical protein Q7S44_02210 [bacterium]|nr:hypothetical protein [bacterium]